MEDIFELLYDIFLVILESIFPKKFKEWLFSIPNFFRYFLVLLFYVIVFAIVLLIMLLFYWLYRKIIS